MKLSEVRALSVVMRTCECELLEIEAETETVMVGESVDSDKERVKMSYENGFRNCHVHFEY